jgi:hypothetical protein
MCDLDVYPPVPEPKDQNEVLHDVLFRLACERGPSPMLRRVVTFLVQDDEVLALSVRIKLLSEAGIRIDEIMQLLSVQQHAVIQSISPDWR